MNKKKLLPTALLGVLVAGQAMAVTYTFKTIDGPGATNTWPSAINASGQVVGTYTDGTVSHGFMYSGGVLSTLDVPGAATTVVSDINASGQVVGSYNRAINGPSQGFIFSGGSFTIVDIASYPGITPPDWHSTALNGINDSGQVIGQSVFAYNCNGCPRPPTNRIAFIYSSGNVTSLGFQTPTSINASGQVVGYSESIFGPFSEFYLYNSNQGLKTLKVPGSDRQNIPLSINDHGQVAGYYYGNAVGFQGFLYDNNSNVFTTLSVTSGSNPIPRSINNNGQVVGDYDYFNNSLSGSGFVYNGGSYAAINIPNAAKTVVNNNNDNGQLIGAYTDSAGLTHAFIATPVVNTPKPTREKDCKKGGWKKFGFKNKGQCEKYVEKLKGDKEDHDDD